MVNKVRVNIAGTPYAIATTDSEKYILGLAKKLDEDITLVVKWSATADENGNHWSYVVSSGKGDTDTISIDKDGVLHFNIVNQHGLTLPFTGGEGANLLAGLGLALMAAAVAAILYIKRRQNRE